ncbi:MAG: YlmC/YmxH family sporulation protein [Oscillospiraceae bacterium]|nr:YlmC/YmxH family sporulation protein [Oscillospiraceae bacterium]
MTHTTVADLRYKEIINLSNGNRLGFVYDAEITLPEGQVTALIVPGPARFFGLFGREEDLVIPWERISKIGDDIILVELEGEPRRHHRRDPRMKKKGLFF